MSKIEYIGLLFAVSTFILPSNALADGIAETRYHGHQTIFTRSAEGKHYLTASNFSWDDEFFITINKRDLEYPPAWPYHLGVSDNDDYWSEAEHDNDIGDWAALDVHFASGVVHTFLSTWGVEYWTIYPLVSYVNVCCKSGGAGYSPAEHEIHYFISSEDQPYSLGTFIDVVAHEHMHAILATKAGIFTGGFASNSGTVQESLSDIFSTLVQHHYNGQYGGDANVWMYSRYPFHDLRDLANPHSGIPEDPQPDTLGGQYWSSTIHPSHGADDMYRNTGVFNHWAYLVSEGSSATDEVNDNGDTFAVEGQGIEQLSVWMNEFLSTIDLSGINFAGGWETLRDQFTQAAINLGAANLFGNTLASTTINASHAVGLFGPLKPPTDISIQTYETWNGQLITWKNFVWEHAGYNGTWHENEMMGSMILQTRKCKLPDSGPRPKPPELSDTQCSQAVTLQTFDYLPWSAVPGKEFAIVNFPYDDQQGRQYRLIIDDYFERHVKTDWF